ncbi:response regulator [Lachnospiraceae bacterium]|nr:response regulator [Lachnospiraceae bacterium]
MTKKIVIVEDEFRIRQGLSNLINKVDMGCRVIGEAENGYEGIKMVRDMEPDIVITDIRMPKINGLEMIEKIKEMGIHCVFVILSGYSDFEYARTGIRLGVKEYLLKPATISDVKELLKKLVDQEEKRAEDTRMQEYSVAVKEMVSVIEENYGMRLGLDSFADKFRLTPEYLSNLFAKETGMTFSNYLKKIRMEKAKELILNTDMKIYEVACSVGYPDQKYFSKVFKEYTGVSAKQYAIDERKNK